MAGEGHFKIHSIVNYHSINLSGSDSEVNLSGGSLGIANLSIRYESLFFKIVDKRVSFQFGF